MEKASFHFKPNSRPSKSRNKLLFISFVTVISRGKRIVYPLGCRRGFQPAIHRLCIMAFPQVFVKLQLNVVDETTLHLYELFLWQFPHSFKCKLLSLPLQYQDVDHIENFQVGRPPVVFHFAKPMNKEGKFRHAVVFDR